MDYAQVWERILSFKKIVIITHQKPDGDAIGSALAMHHRLTRLGKKSYLFNLDASRIPLELRFLRESQNFSDKVPANADAWIFLDCANPARTGAPWEEERPWVLNIDHHESNSRFGDVNIVDSSKVATGVVLASFLKAQDRLNKPESEAIYAAILTDSNFFKNDRIDAELFRLCGDLMESGVEPAKINDSLTRSEPLAKIRLLERILSRLALHHDARLASSYLLEEDFQSLGGGVHMLEGMADYPLSLSTVRMGIFTYEIAPKRFKVSLRSQAPHPCNDIAAKLGGGGHPYAAGYISSHSTLEKTLQEALDLCKERLS